MKKLRTALNWAFDTRTGLIATLALCFSLSLVLARYLNVQPPVEPPLLVLSPEEDRRITLIALRSAAISLGAVGLWAWWYLRRATKHNRSRQVLP